MCRSLMISTLKLGPVDCGLRLVKLVEMKRSLEMVKFSDFFTEEKIKRNGTDDSFYL